MERVQASAELADAYDEAVQDFQSRYGGGSPRVRLRLARKLLGLSQREFAERFGLNPLTVRNWEADSRPQPSGVAEAFIALVSADPQTALKLSHRAHMQTGESSTQAPKSTTDKCEEPA